VGINMARVMIVLDPNDSETTELIVSNNEEQEMTVKTEIYAHNKTDKNGFPILWDNPKGNPKDITDWITLKLNGKTITEKDRITIGPKSDTAIEMTVKAPADAEPGSYLASLVFLDENDNPLDQIKLNGGVSSRIMVTVTGVAIHKLNLKKFVLEEFFNDKPVDFALELQSKGNVYEIPEIKIAILDADARKKQIPEVFVYNDPISGEKLLSDSVLPNYKQGSIFAENLRLFNGEWNQNIKNGNFIANLMVEYGGGGKIKDTLEFQIQDDLEITKPKISKPFGDSSIYLKIKAENKGNVAERLLGQVEVQNSQGLKINNIDLATSKDVQYQDLKCEEKEYEEKFAQSPKYIFPTCTATVTLPVLIGEMPGGKYKAIIDAKYGFENTPIKKTIIFSNGIDYLFWGMIIGGMIIFILLVTVIILLVKRKRKPKDKDNKDESESENKDNTSDA
jgi:hypothetical protein